MGAALKFTHRSWAAAPAVINRSWFGRATMNKMITKSCRILAVTLIASVWPQPRRYNGSEPASVS